MHIGAAHAYVGAAVATENLRKNIIAGSEVGKSGVVRIGRTAAFGEVAIEAVLWPLHARCIDFAAIEPRPLVGVSQQVVGRRDFLELFLGPLVTRVKVRMQLFRQPPIGLLDVLLGRFFLHAQNCVGIGRQSDLRRKLVSFAP